MGDSKCLSEFLKAVPDALEQEETYKARVTSAAGKGDLNLDLLEWELSTFGMGEKNLLRDLEIADKFKKDGMDEKFEISSVSFKQNGHDFGKGILKYSKCYEESFLSSDTIYLEPAGIDTNGCAGMEVLDNAPLYGSLLTMLRNMPVGDMTDVSMMYIGKRLMMKPDLRHLFLKGYLLLMGHNLGVVSGHKKYAYNMPKVKVVRGVSSIDKMRLFTNYKMVVDVKRLTREEVWFLAEMANEFPSRQYGKDNIYNSLQMDADEVVFISDDPKYTFGGKPVFGSPEKLWYDLIQIAIKFNALEDLRQVVRDFRGLPFLLKTIAELTGKTGFPLGYPKSYSLFLGIGASVETLPTIVRHSEYYATTKNLVADLMLGQMCCMSVFSLIEELGALGLVGCPSGEAKTDGLFDSLLRTVGIKTGEEARNILLLEWRGIRGVSAPVGFGGMLKSFVQQFAHKLRLGDNSLLRPQLLFALPFSSLRNTTWAMVHKWKFPDLQLTDAAAKRVMANQMTRAYLWVMGVGDIVPRVGRNIWGTRFMENFTEQESSFLLVADGEYEIGLVRHGIKS